MKHLNYLLGVALLLLGFSWASAETVTNYTVDFNTTINTSDHAFRVAPGWGHDVKSYEDWYSDEETFVDYTYDATGGVEGTGALKIGTQVLNSSWVNDMLVTPALTGTVTLKVKAVSGAGLSSTGIKIFKVTKNGKTYTQGDVVVNESGSAGIIQNTDDWYTVTVSNLDNEMLGIIGSRVWIDDFAVEGSANVELEKALTMNSVTLQGSNTCYCDAEGNFTFTYIVKFTNTGECALDNTMDNYTLTLGGVKYVSGSGYVIDDEKILTTIPIEAASIAIDEQVEQTLVINANISSPAFGGNGTRSRIDVREDISGSSGTGSWIEPIKYEPIVTLRDQDGWDMIDNPSHGVTFGSFGMVSENTTKNMTVRNSGAAPAVITITMPEGFTAEPASFTVESAGSTTVVVTLLADEPGIKNGDMVVAIEGVDEPLTLALSGTVLDNTKFFENFETNNTSDMLPVGWWDVDGAWEKTDHTNGNNNYAEANYTVMHKLITPLLKVTEGEKMTFEARKKTSDSKINVYYSLDRKEWTLVKEIPNGELNSEFQTYVLEGVPAGNYYIAFESGYAAIDNVYGFELVPVDVDVVVKEFRVPSTIMANNDATATVKLQNLLGEAVPAD